MDTTFGLMVHLAITAIVCAGVILTRQDRTKIIGAGLILVFFGFFSLITGKYPGRSISDISGLHQIFAGFVCLIGGGVLLLVKPRSK